MRIFKRLLRCTRGSALVEFAFVSPVLILLIVGILDVGRMLYVSGTMRHAVGEGLRFAKVERDASAAAISSRVRTSLTAVDPDGITELSIVSGAVNRAQFIRIRLRYRYEHVARMLALPAFTLTEERQIWLPR